jgi:hypothetical protein
MALIEEVCQQSSITTALIFVPSGHKREGIVSFIRLE